MDATRRHPSRVVDVVMKFFSVIFISFFCFVPPSFAKYMYKSKYAAIVVRPRTNTILYARNARVKRYPASLTKIMTLYLVFKSLRSGLWKMSTPLTVSRHASVQEPSKIGVRVGEKISVRTAIRAIIVHSANDVAVAVAENMYGSEANFVAHMNAMASRIGMHSTVFKNASGLPSYGQVTTAYDMAVLATRIYKEFPQYYSLFKTRYFAFDGVRYMSHNRLLFQKNGVDGIKTGYIRLSGFNSVISAKRHGKRIICVVFGGISWRLRDRYMNLLLEKGFRVINDMQRRPMDPKMIVRR